MSRFPLPVGLTVGLGRGLQRALLETVPETVPVTPARRGKNKRQGCASAPAPRRVRERTQDRLLEALQQHHPRRSVALHQSGGALR